jgi:hypothetical protein
MKQYDEKKLGARFDSALREVCDAMYRLELVLEEYEGMEDIICDGYPFGMSFDEQVAEVFAWSHAVAEKVAGK